MDAPHTAPVPNEDRAAAELLGSCIIIVDDELDNADLFVRALRRQGYTNLHATTNPREGLRLCLTLQPDVLILDLHMPGFGGIELLRELRGHEEPGHRVPVLVVSADDSGESKRQVQALGAEGFMVKPVNFALFRSKVRDLLETPSPGRRPEERGA